MESNPRKLHLLWSRLSTFTGTVMGPDERLVITDENFPVYLACLVTVK